MQNQFLQCGKPYVHSGKRIGSCFKNMKLKLAERMSDPVFLNKARKIILLAKQSNEHRVHLHCKVHSDSMELAIVIQERELWITLLLRARTLRCNEIIQEVLKINNFINSSVDSISAWYLGSALNTIAINGVKKQMVMDVRSIKAFLTEWTYKLLFKSLKWKSGSLVLS